MAAYGFDLIRYVTDDGRHLAIKGRSDITGANGVIGDTPADGTEMMPGNWVRFKPRVVRAFTASGHIHAVVCYTNDCDAYAGTVTHVEVSEGGALVLAKIIDHEGERMRVKRIPAYSAPAGG